MFRALALFIALAAGAPAFAAGDGQPTTPSAGSPGANPAVRAAPPATLLVAGVILAPPTKAAVIVTLDRDGRETASVRVNEGEIVDGYRVAAVEPDRVFFEGSGQTFAVRLGRPLPPASAPKGPTETTEQAPTASPGRGRPRIRRVPAGTVAPSAGPEQSPPPNIDELRKKAQPVLDALRNHPGLRQKFEQMRPVIRQRVEDSRAAGSEQHAGRGDAQPQPPASQ